VDVPVDRYVARQTAKSCDLREEPDVHVDRIAPRLEQDRMTGVREMRAFLFAEDGVDAGLQDGCGHVWVDDEDVGTEIRQSLACGCGSGGERSDEAGSAESLEKRAARVVQGRPLRYPLRNRRRVMRTRSGSVTGLSEAEPHLNHLIRLRGTQ
jgi:hypothetical protein